MVHIWSARITVSTVRLALTPQKRSLLRHERKPAWFSDGHCCEQGYDDGERSILASSSRLFGSSKRRPHARGPRPLSCHNSECHAGARVAMPPSGFYGVPLAPSITLSQPTSNILLSLVARINRLLMKAGTGFKLISPPCVTFFGGWPKSTFSFFTLHTNHQKHHKGRVDTYVCTI